MAAPNRLVSLAFEAVTTPHIHGGYSVLHAACMEKDVRTCKTILSCSPSKLDTIIALNVRVPKRLVDTCQTKATLGDLAKNRNCSSELCKFSKRLKKYTAFVPRSRSSKERECQTHEKSFKARRRRKQAVPISR